MMVLLRVGPYICAEWDFGGFPWWLGSSMVSKSDQALTWALCCCTTVVARWARSTPSQDLGAAAVLPGTLCTLLGSTGSSIIQWTTQAGCAAD